MGLGEHLSTEFEPGFDQVKLDGGVRPRSAKVASDKDEIPDDAERKSVSVDAVGGPPNEDHLSPDPGPGFEREESDQGDTSNGTPSSPFARTDDQTELVYSLGVVNDLGDDSTKAANIQQPSRSVTGAEPGVCLVSAKRTSHLENRLMMNVGRLIDETVCAHPRRTPRRREALSVGGQVSVRVQSPDGMPRREQDTGAG